MSIPPPTHPFLPSFPFLQSYAGGGNDFCAGGELHCGPALYPFWAPLRGPLGPIGVGPVHTLPLPPQFAKVRRNCCRRRSPADHHFHPMPSANHSSSQQQQQFLHKFPCECEDFAGRCPALLCPPLGGHVHNAFWICVAGFTFAHLALCLERAIATWHIRAYEQFSAKLGVALLLPMFLLPIGWNVWIFHEENLTGHKAYCMSSSATSSPRMLQMSYILIGLDLLAVIIDFGLYWANKRQKMKKTTDYSLRKSFQLRENDLSMRLLLPLSISHSLMFCCFLAVYTLLKMVFAHCDGLTYAAVVESAHLIETLYTLVSVALFMALRRRLSRRMRRLAISEMRLKKSEQANLHAAQYQKHW